MRILTNIIILVLLFSTAIAQRIQWADEVITFSSEKSTTVGSAKNVLGKPSVSKGFGSTPSAWSPSFEWSKGEEFIQVKFSSPMAIEKIGIIENYNPGSICKVILSDSEGEEYKVYENKLFPYLDESYRIFEIKTGRTPYQVVSAKVYLNTSKVPGFQQIDAIGISDDINASFAPVINTYKGQAITTKPENLGIKINSEYSELAPIISFDGKKLYFTRSNHPDNIGEKKALDIWYSELAKGAFQEAVNLGRPLNNEYNNYAISLSPSNNELLVGNVYNDNAPMSKGISLSFLNNGVWAKPTKVEIKNFISNNNNSSYNLSSNGKVLLVGVEGVNSIGGNDIYACFLDSEGVWTEPLNLGNVVNSSSDEISPFLAADGVTLFYSSSGFPGYGMNDLFVTHRLDDGWTNWSEPENLGNVINSDGWDAYYTIPANGEYAYFVSSNNSIGVDDIFRVKLPAELKPKTVVLLSGNVRNQKDSLPLATKIIYSRLADGKELGIARSDSATGEFKIVLPAGEKYSFLAEAKGFIAVNQNIDLTGFTNYDEVKRDISMVKIEKGSSIRLNNIFFEFKEFTLLPESFPELKRVIKFMKDNPEVSIEIQGFTDNIGTQDRNLKLSHKRAESVESYLIENGALKDHISSKGYGKDKPVADNSTEEGRTLNRRVEFQIVK